MADTDYTKLCEYVSLIVSEARISKTELTARHVRAECERRLGLPPDGLVDRKDELTSAIAMVLRAPDPETVKEQEQAIIQIQKQLEHPTNGPSRAAILVAELDDADVDKSAAEALAALADICAGSELATKRLCDAKITGPLSTFLPHEIPKATTSLALRMLLGMAVHTSITEVIVRSSITTPLLARLATSGDSIGLQCALLVHNLADAPATRMRLLHAGTLEVLTRILVEPAAGPQIKEHCLQAAASLAGVPESEHSFPELVGKFLGARLPGTQKKALTALQLIRERGGSNIDERLAACDVLVDGLRTAAASADADVAADAEITLAALELPDAPDLKELNLSSE